VLNLDPAKLLVILVLALIVLGPERLPKAARQLGSAWRTLTNLREQVTEEVRRAIPDVDIPHIPGPGAVSGFLNTLTRPPDRPTATGSAPAAPQIPTGERAEVGEPIGLDDPAMN
jgi:mttA/Hcf106 family